MNPSITDHSIHDPQCFKVFLRIFIERIRRNRDDAQGVFMSELYNKASSSTKILEEETTLREGENTILNHHIRKPKEVKVDLNITLDEYEPEDKAEDIEDGFLDSFNDGNTDVPQNSSEEREREIKESTDDIDINPESSEGRKVSQFLSIPDRTETMEIWQSQLENLIIKGSEELKNKLEEQGRDVSPANNEENEPPTRVKNAGRRVVQQAFQAITPLECPSSSKTWGTQYKNIAKKCSRGVEEEPEELTGNEQEIHMNPVSHEEPEYSTVLKNAMEETHYKNDVEECPETQASTGLTCITASKKYSQEVQYKTENLSKNKHPHSYEETNSSSFLENTVEQNQCQIDVKNCSEILEEPTNNVEKKSLHKDSLKESLKPETYCFRAIVPPRWYSTLKSENPVSYGWKVASLVKVFERLPQQQIVENPSIKRPVDDQQSSAMTDPIENVRVASKEGSKTSADEQYYKTFVWESPSTADETSSSSVVETSAFQPNVSANELQRPEHGISDVASLVMLKYEKPQYAKISPHTDKQVSLVVQDIVRDNYKEAWSRAARHRIRRESLRKSLTFHSCSEDDSIPEYSEIEENSSYEPFDNSESEYKKCLSSDSGLSHSDATESSRNSVKREEVNNTTSGYDRHRILKEVLVEKAKSTGDIGDKSDQGNNDGLYYTVPKRSCQSLIPDEVSIGSSNISALLSSCPARRSETLSYYSASSRTRKPPPSRTTTSTGYYDVVPEKVNEMLKERNNQLEITKQVSKAVLICRRQRKVIRQDVQVEAEKILLLATRRRDIIDEELSKCSGTPKETPPIFVSVSLKNFNFSRAVLMSGNKYCKKYSWFFVLVLEAGTAVLASEVVKGDSEILIEDSFQFEGKSGDFPINVKLFALVLKNHKKKNKNCRRMISAPIPSPDYAPTHSFFNLWGSCELKPSRLSRQGKNCFTLTQIPPEASLSSTFSVDMEMRLKIMVFKRGFLTVGLEDPNRLPVWNRRWCVLDGANLKYWNNPNEEEVSEPVGHLDLVNARSHEVQLVKKELCPWPKCLSLDIEWNKSAVREYFLSADTPEEFNEWQEQLNLVLGYLNKWKSSQERVECGK